MELKEGYKQTEVGVIPEAWNHIKIKEACKLINGRGFKPFEWKTEGLPIIRIQNLNGSDEYNYFQGIYDKKLEVEYGQLLFAWSGSRGTSFGPYMWKGEKGLLNYHTWKIVVDEKVIEISFFLHALKQLTRFIENNAHGASALVHTQKWEMEGFEFACPPTKAEQTAIATALSDADDLIAGLEKLIAKKRNIKQGAMQELLTGKRRLSGFEKVKGYKQTEVGIIPVDWNITNIVDNSTLKARIGWQGLTTSEYLENGEYYLVTGTDFLDGKIKWETCHYVEKTRYLQDKNIQLNNNDILITKDGTIGKVVFIDKMTLPGTLNSGVFVIRPKNKDYIPLYVFYIFKSIFFSEFLRKLVAGSTINHLYQKDFVTFKFPLPPTLTEQTAIATILSDMDAEITALETKLEKYKMIKQGMMQNLLTGKIRIV